jgi:membrane protein YdbS with pleckstrin-like domain
LDNLVLFARKGGRMQRKYVPNPRYRTKLYLTITLIAVAVQVANVVLAGLISLDRESGPRSALIALIVCTALNGLWWAPLMIWSGFYHRSLSYEIGDEQVIVRQGVLTRAVKHVPYRTVTNITVKRGLIDRWLGLGTLEIQTAGVSGTQQAEQSLVGLADPDEVYALVVGQLSRFRGAMAPTQAEEEAPSGVDETLAALLAEVRAIREMLEQSD